MPTINVDLARSRYARLVGGYDHATRRMEPVRRRAVDALQLRPGDRVLDVACGTGKSFELLRNAVGSTGEVVGVDVSGDMILKARARIGKAGWDNVVAIESPMDLVNLEGSFDAALFVYTQDVLQSRASLDKIFAHVAEDARVVSTGLKLFPWYLFPLNLYVVTTSWQYFTTLGGLGKPWNELLSYVSELRVESTFLGSGYLASGRVSRKESPHSRNSSGVQRARATRRAPSHLAE